MKHVANDSHMLPTSPTSSSPHHSWAPALLYIFVTFLDVAQIVEILNQIVPLEFDFYLRHSQNIHILAVMSYTL